MFYEQILLLIVEYQTINLDKYSLAIDQNKVSYNFSAWVGGWEKQEDDAFLWVNFYNSYGVIITNATISAVTVADRMGVSQLLYRQVTGMVPVNTRSVRLSVGMIGTTYNNDASVDNISLKLKYIP